MKLKNLFTLLSGISIVACINTYAQNTHETDLLNAVPANKGKTRMASAPVHTGAKTTSLKSRLTGVMNAYHNGAYFEPVDSYSYKYSGMRGGDLNADALKFDNGIKNAFAPSTGAYSQGQRMSQTFDANDNVLSTLYEVWDAPSTSWKNDDRYLSVYDATNNMTSYIRQYWSNNLGEWVNSSQTLYTYDSKGNLLTEVDRTWSTSADNWVNQEKYSFTYNAASQVLSRLYQDWDNYNSEWDNQNQYLDTYDSTGNMSSEIYQTWSSMSNAWRNQNKTGWTYDANKNVTLRLEQTWNSGGGGYWLNDNQTTYTYDSVITKNLMERVYQTWSSFKTAWVNSTHTRFTHDAAGNVLTEQGQVWIDFSVNNWRNNYLNTSTYDGSRNQLSHLEQNWSSSQNAWINSRVYNYSYNSYSQMTSRQSNTWNSGGFWFPVTSDYLTNYYYEEYGTTSVASTEKKDDALALYPVPANDQLNIDLNWSKSEPAVIAIFDMFGRLAAQWQTPQTNNYHNTMNVSGFPAGNYIMKIKGQTQQTAKQFVVVD